MIANSGNPLRQIYVIYLTNTGSAVTLYRGRTGMNDAPIRGVEAAFANSSCGG